MKKEKKNEPKPKSIPTKNHVLIEDVPIGDKVVKKGTSYPLTEMGRKYFKSQNYIK